MKYIAIVLLLTFSTPVYAGFNIGVSSVVAGYTNTSLSYNIGYLQELGDKFVGVSTNVLYPTKNRDNIRGFDVESKVTHYTGFFGKKFGRWTVSPFLSYVIVDNKVYLNNINIINNIRKVVVGGGILNYFLTKNIATSLFIVLPHPDIVKFSGGFAINFYF